MSEKKINQFFLPCTPRSAKRQRSSSSPELAVASDNKEMEQGKVGELTQTQLMACLSALLDQKLANLATKDDMIVLSSKVESLQIENKTMKEELFNLKQKQRLIVSKLVDLESRSRRNNLIFRGIKVPERANDYCHYVRQFCTELFGCDKLYVNRAHPLGKDRKAIIAHLPDDGDIQYIMSRVNVLKNTSYTVHRDYPMEIREKRAKLAKVRAEVERVSGRRKMPLIHDHLVIEGCHFTWDGKLRSGAVDGDKKLQELVGRDFSEFLIRLQEGDTHKTDGQSGRPIPVERSASGGEGVGVAGVRGIATEQ